MQFEKYEIRTSSSFLRFEFYSIGPKGKIKKQVIFKAFKENPEVFNLAFGDVGKNGEVNDLIITGNKDSKKVLATVVATVFKFFEKYPNAYIFATGSTKSRTRLYRIGITNNLQEMNKSFELYGYINQNWEKFEKNKDYEAFLAKLISEKNSNFEKI
ncbi:DUF6934 family protein [Ferruginibacter sp. SUN106]|uniref:DUF6934 family protein n=1 Tax=Ferruginibacter sp. SUN106 TaxID=2978348 RepID=UPI003D359B53